jgi:hypothetical protein
MAAINRAADAGHNETTLERDWIRLTPLQPCLDPPPISNDNTVGVNVVPPVKNGIIAWYRHVYFPIRDRPEALDRQGFAPLRMGGGYWEAWRRGGDSGPAAQTPVIPRASWLPLPRRCSTPVGPRPTAIAHRIHAFLVVVGRSNHPRLGARTAPAVSGLPQSGRMPQLRDGAVGGPPGILAGPRSST